MNNQLDKYITITKASYFAMEDQINAIRQQTIKECADLVMDWENVDMNMTAGQRILEKLGD